MFYRVIFVRECELGGVGLGLFIVKVVVELYYGCIIVEFVECGGLWVIMLFFKLWLGMLIVFCSLIKSVIWL